MTIDRASRCMSIDLAKVEGASFVRMGEDETFSADD